MQLLRQAMLGVVEAPNGTGKLARVQGIEVAGKTGTAQNPHGEDHACFIAYAPADDPQIAIAVVAENAGGGGSFAAPIAREVIKAYLRIEDEPEPYPSVAFPRRESNALEFAPDTPPAELPPAAEDEERGLFLNSPRGLPGESRPGTPGDGTTGGEDAGT
jgi:membrane peptidoglycan carboxypeptidase